MNKAYFPRKQICCNDKLIGKRTHGCCNHKSFLKSMKYCCGDEALPRVASKERCCGKNKKTYRPDLGEKCCSNEKIATADEICCGMNIVTNKRKCCQPRNIASPVGTVYNPITQRCCSSKADGHFLIVKNTIEGEHGCCNGETYLMHTESCTRNMYGIKMVTPLRP